MIAHILKVLVQICSLLVLWRGYILEEAAEIAVTDLTTSLAARDKSGSHKVELVRRNGQLWMIAKQQPQGFKRFFKARNKGQVKSPDS